MVCAMLISTEKGIKRCLEMNHPANDAVCDGYPLKKELYGAWKWTTRQRRCATLISAEMGNIRYLEMNHPVNDAGYVELRGICKGNIVKQIESQKQWKWKATHKMRTAGWWDKLEVDETILLRQRWKRDVIRPKEGLCSSGGSSKRKKVKGCMRDEGEVNR